MNPGSEKYLQCQAESAEASPDTQFSISGCRVIEYSRYQQQTDLTTHILVVQCVLL